MKKIRGLGTHLMATLVDCNNDRLQDYDMIYNLLKSFPPLINMTLIPVNPNPILFQCHQDKKNIDNTGLSGSCLLWESHFALHTWPVYNEVDIDVFSCYDYDTKKTIQYLVNFFEGTAVNVSIVSRGNNGIIWSGNR